MGYITPFQYYYNENNNPINLNWGSYQYVSLADIVNNFMLMYQGNTSLVNNESRYKVIFHAKQAIKELNIDAANEFKILEFKVDGALRFVLPPDYLNWVRVSWEKDGKLYPLQENTQTMSALTYLQDNNDKILFDQDGYCLSPEFSNLEEERIFEGNMGLFGRKNEEREGREHNGRWFYRQRFGLNPETANSRPKFTIDKRNGVINFFSDMTDELVVLEYISDGMENGDESKICVNKMLETYLYAYIEYQLLDSKLGTQEYVVKRKERKSWALLRNAKIRVSNINPSRLLMCLRGMDKILK